MGGADHDVRDTETERVEGTREQSTKVSNAREGETLP